MPDTTPLTPKEQRFIEHYCAKTCAAKAARLAGYSEKSAADIGYQLLKKPHIKAAVEARLQELSLGPKETTKLISDIAKSDINEFYDILEVDEPTQIDKPLIEIIFELEEEVKFEEDFAQRAGLEADALKSHQGQQKNRRLRILRLQMELEKEPLATRKVPGPPAKKQVAELNMVKLIQAKDNVRIKSIKPGQFGTTVDLYPADAALRDMAKIHGLFIEKIDHTSGGKSFFDLLADSTDDSDTGTKGEK